MIKTNQRLLNFIHVVLDVILIIASYFLALFISFGRKMSNDFSLQNYILVLSALVPIYLIIFKSFSLYNPKRLLDSFDIIKSIFVSNIVGILILGLFLYLFRKHENIMHFSIRVVGLFFIFNVLLICIERVSIKQMLSYMRRNGYNQKHMVLVGFSDASSRLIDAILRNPEWGYTIDGIYDDITEKGTEYRGSKVVGNLKDFSDTIQDQDIDEVSITLPLAAYSKLGEVVGVCEKYGIHTKFIPDYSDVISSNPVTGDMDGVTVVNIRNVPLSDPINSIFKRVIDIICSIIFIIIFSPIMLITAIAVKISSPGPILYKQPRVGYHNKEFNMLKFRSMIQQDVEEEKKGWTTKGDSRVTKIGAIIRKTSIDELPQFFNVLLGTMSIVGPRPERKQFVEKFMEEIPRYNVKHQVRPGITGWAQVNGLRGDTSISERIKYDLYYVEHWSIWFDIKIMILTVFKGFINKNAY